MVSLFIYAKPFAGPIQKKEYYKPYAINPRQAKAETWRGKQEGTMWINDLACFESQRKKGENMQQLNQVPMEDIKKEGNTTIGCRYAGEAIIPILREIQENQGHADRHTAILQRAGIFCDIQKREDTIADRILSRP